MKSNGSIDTFPFEDRVTPDIQIQHQQLAALAELVGRCSLAENVSTAASQLARDLKSYLRCQRVVVGIRKSQKRIACSVQEDSDRARPDGSSEDHRLIASVLSECIARNEDSEWPPSDAKNRFGLLCHQQFTKHFNIPHVSTALLVDDFDHVRGCILLATEQPLPSRARAFLSAISQPLACVFRLHTKAMGNYYDRCWNRLVTLYKKRQLLIVAMLISLLAICSIIPRPYHVSCNCVLEPVTQQTVSAPFECRIATTAVKPGDIVTQSQILSTLDESDIQWELSSQMSESHRLERHLAGHIAAHETAEATIARLELDRVQLRIDQLVNRLQQLDVRSPIDGLVIEGNLNRLSGAAVEKGDALLRIAPLDEMLVEIEIPDNQIRLVRDHMLVSVRFHSFPWDTFEAQVQRIYPRAELRDAANVFVAETRLHNHTNQLRPGMRGRATIITDSRPLAWHYLHQPWGSLKAFCGW